MAIVTYPLNNIEYTAEDAERYLCTRTSGVFSSDNNFAIQLSSAWGVTIGTGVAWIKNTDFSGKSVVNTESKELDIGLADPTFPKIVRIVLEYDKAKNASDIIVLSGTPATIPTAPAISRTESKYDLCLYEITIPAGASQITMSNVKNTMLDESLCGIMRDAVTGIPTAQLQSQVQSLIDELNEALQGAIDGSLYIPRTEKASANGVATLDENSLLTLSQLPIEYGTWNPKLLNTSTGAQASYTSTKSTGQYAKIGRMVYVSAQFERVNIATDLSAQKAGVGDLPFEVMPLTAFSLEIGNRFSIFANEEIFAQAKGQYVSFAKNQGGDSATFAKTSNGYLYFSGWYMTGQKEN